MTKRRVVITGMGLVTPLGFDVDHVWQALLAGKSGIHPLTMVDRSEFKVQIGGDIPDFDVGDFADAREAKRLDRFTQFALFAGGMAVRDSGLDFTKEDVVRCGSILGSGIGGLWEIEAQMERLITKGPDRVGPLTVPKMMLNAAGANLSIAYGLRGPNFSIATACASATNAMGSALCSIQKGETDIMITGGSEAAMTRMGVAGFQNMKALAVRNDEPEKASRPFDRDRNGFVLSEGAGVLIFEEFEHARQRGAQIYAEVIGFGCSCDAGHITQPDPYGTGAAEAMKLALKDAEISPSDVDYINAHGTSTPLGDKAETRAIHSVFGKSAKDIVVSSTKSSLGHSLGASGGIELVISARTLTDGVIAPTINLDNPDPECDLDYAPNQAREANVRIAMSNSFGFGGHNACILIKKM